MVMDRMDYRDKAKNLMEQPDYRELSSDPTNKNKAKLINILKRIKKQSGLDDNTYKNMYPKGESSPKFYGLPKIHKKDTSL